MNLIGLILVIIGIYLCVKRKSNTWLVVGIILIILGAGSSYTSYTTNDEETKMRRKLRKIRNKMNGRR